MKTRRSMIMHKKMQARMDMMQKMMGQIIEREAMAPQMQGRQTQLLPCGVNPGISEDGVSRNHFLGRKRAVIVVTMWPALEVNHACGGNFWRY